MKYAKIINTISGYWIILNDNMMLFDAEKTDFILKRGIINQIICSIDGVDKLTFERMRPGADFDLVINNTFNLLQRKKEGKEKFVIQINNGIDESCKRRKIDPKLKKLFNSADHLTRWEPVDWNESFHTGSACYSPSNHFCSFAFESLALTTSGAITRCCMDSLELTKYGDFTKDTLESIWLSDTRRSILQLMHEGKRNLISGCNKCSITYVSQNKLSN